MDEDIFALLLLIILFFFFLVGAEAIKATVVAVRTVLVRALGGRR